MVGERFLEYFGPTKVEMSPRFLRREGVVEESRRLNWMLTAASDLGQTSDALLARGSVQRDTEETADGTVGRKVVFES